MNIFPLRLLVISLVSLYGIIEIVCPLKFPPGE